MDPERRQPGDASVGLQKPDAIIFIPGIGNAPNQSLDCVGIKLARALDLDARDHSDRFELRAEAAIGFGMQQSAACRSVHRVNGMQTCRVVDLFALDYQAALAHRLSGKSGISVLLLFTGVVLRGWLRFIRGAVGAASSGVRYVQMFVGLAVLLLVTGYMVFILVSAVAALLSVVETRLDMTEIVPIASISRWFAAALLTIGAVEAVVPVNYRNSLRDAAILAAGVFRYLSPRTVRRAELVSMLRELLEAVLERGVQYRHIHLVGYSFGSIIAIDALFDPSRTARRFAHVHTLVTIGSPVEVIKTYWPTYLTKRDAGPDAPFRWVNIYSNQDLLASSFHASAQVWGVETKDGSEVLPQANIAYPDDEPLALWETLLLRGFRVHAAYWHQENEHASEVFATVAHELPLGEK